MARHNGHEALGYQPLVDVSPHLADSLLDLLALHGIAAYAGPAMRHTWASHPQPWMTSPIDRIFVDCQAAELARSVLSGHLPPQGAEEESVTSRCAPQALMGAHTAARVDAQAWDQVMTSYQLPSYFLPHEPSTAPAVSERPAEDTDEQVAESETGRIVRLVQRDNHQLDNHQLDNQHFHPSGRGYSHWVFLALLGWFLLLGSALMLLVAAAFEWNMGGWLGALGVSCCLAGFVMVLAQPNTPNQRNLTHHDDGPDSDELDKFSG